MARDVVSYLITAEDKTRAATQSARANLDGLRASYANTARAMGQLGAVMRGGAFVLVAREIAQSVGAVANWRAELERTQNTLAQGVGAENVASEMRFLRGAAEDFGLSFKDMAASYSRFTAATKGTALEGERTREIFLAVSKAATVLGLSTEQTQGALTAFQQMISKGTVQAEELRGQLAERLPGAFQIAARAMGMTTSELGKFVESGQLLAEDLIPRMAAQMNQEFGPAFANASNSATAALNRLQSAWDGLKQTIAGGFIGRAVISEIEGLTRMLDDFGNSLDAVSLGMLNWLGISRSALSGKEVEDFVGALKRNENVGEARLRREGGTDPTGERERAAAAAAEEARVKRASEAWTALNKKYQTAAERNKEIADEIRKAGLAAKLSEKEIDALIRKATAPKGKTGKSEAQREAERAAKEAAREAAQVDRERLQSNISLVRDDLDSLVNVYRNHAQLLDAQRQANLIADEEYFQKRRDLIDKTADAEVKALLEQNRLMREQKADPSERIDLDRQIAANLEEIERIQTTAYTQGVIMSTQMTDAKKKEAAAWRESVAAAKDYLDTMRRGYQRDIESANQGPIERDRLSGRQQIEEAYQQRRADLQTSNLRGEFDTKPGEYERQLDLINRFQQQALADWEEYYATRRKQEESAADGLIRGLRRYADEAKNVAEQVSQVTQFAFRGMEDVAIGAIFGDGDRERDKLRDEISRLEARKAEIQAGRYEPAEKDRMVAEIDDKLANLRDRLREAKSEFEKLLDEFQREVARIFLRQQIMGPFAQWLANVLGGLGAARGNTGFGTGSNFGNQDYGAFLATGTNYVPHDGFRAVLHKGEAVVPAKFNPAVHGGGAPQLNITINANGAAGDDPERLARLVGDVAVARMSEYNRRGGVA